MTLEKFKKDKLKPLNVMMPESYVEWLRARAVRNGTSISEELRTMVHKSALQVEKVERARKKARRAS